MTQQEKAKQIVFKIYDTLLAAGNLQCYPEAKQCALIAVDEILWEIIKYADNSREYVVENSLYWQQVKQEIEKL